MSSEIPEYEVIVAYGSYSVGAKIRPPAMLRNQLLYRKWIRKVVAPEPVLAVVAAEAATEVIEEPIVEKPKRTRKRKEL
jgi:hypothetical protein